MRDDTEPANPRDAALISPYGGKLVDLLVAPEEREALFARAASLPSVRIHERARYDLELLAVGGFSPLASFMGEADHERVLANMRLTDGRVWPIPITLPVPDGSPVSLGSEIALRDSRNDVLAILSVEEIFTWDRGAEARALTGREDPRHPLVAEMASWGARCVSGPLRVLRLPASYDFRALRLTPAQTRARLLRLGFSRVVAFQTRNPLHRGHEELTKRAASECGAALLLHPAVGMTRAGDVDHYTRVRTYQIMADKYFDPSRTLLALLPLAMRMAGPREAVWHAIVRRNYGASHFIVGRDHAGAGAGSDGLPFFAPQEASDLAASLSPEIGVEIVPVGEIVYLPDEDRFESADRVPTKQRSVSLSGTQVRAEFLEKGRPLPAWLTRPETAAILAELNPPLQARGVCVWFTGLPSSGKSTTAEALMAFLLERGRRVTFLDGDIVRSHLSQGLGFSRADRDINVRRIGFVAAEVVRHGGTAVCAAVSPYRAARNACRAMVGEPLFVEVFMDTPLAVCEARDPKGLYARARDGSLQGLTGIDDPYEAPVSVELRLSAEGVSAEENARSVLQVLIERGHVAA